MKTPRFFLLVLIAASAFALTQIMSVEAPPISSRPVTNSPVEQYRVLDPAAIPVQNAKDAVGALENALNELGAQGWRVRASVGHQVILAR